MAQLGTPDAPTPQALRTYLRQFLSDMRVIDYHPLLWQPILRGIILRTRPSKSAKLYQRIWLDDGSPLLVYSKQQAAGLQQRLGDAYRVVIGMTYGNPSIANALQTFANEGIDQIVVLPMFPQFSSTTTSSVYDAVYQAAAGKTHSFSHDRKRFTPALRFIAPYYDHSGYIQAMRDHLQSEVARLPALPDKFVISFHGIPKRYVATGDPYREQCEHTANLLAEAMGWQDDDWVLTFQSQFGPEKWLEPATDTVLESLHEQGVERPLIFSPGFVTDCLETLDELGNEGREQFAEGGGDEAKFHFASCLNANDDFMDTLAQLVTENAAGWAYPVSEAMLQAAEVSIVGTQHAASDPG
ncbi:MAG: ferrochelatase [Anaerolineaceae bacterium]|nr:ferrochelatase [Anaerolineaceae bacterium]